ncbi:hypothetical protein GP486_003625, partial [Trichoglossum hirsutum]
YIIIHGLNGHPQETWEHKATKFYWPWELRHKLPYARVIVYGYNANIETGLADNLTSISGIASTLISRIVRERKDEEKQLHRPLVLVAHSLGGLVAKKVIILAQRDSASGIASFDGRKEIYRSLRGFMFFGTPHAGSSVDQQARAKLLEALGSLFQTKAPKNIKEALQENSKELAELSDAFEALDIFKTLKFRVTSFYESTTPSYSKVIVPLWSVKLHYPRENVEQIEADHFGMVKFNDENDDNFENVAFQLERIGKADSDVISNLQQNSPSFTAGHTGSILDVLKTYHNTTAEVIKRLLPDADHKIPPQFSLLPTNSFAWNENQKQKGIHLHHPLGESIPATDARSSGATSRGEFIEVLDDNNNSGNAETVAGPPDEPPITPAGFPTLHDNQDEERSPSDPSNSSYHHTELQAQDRALIDDYSRLQPHGDLASSNPLEVAEIVDESSSNVAVNDQRRSALASNRLRKSILCFDSGEIRGLSSLLILKRVISLLQVDLGTGGLIAILLGRLGMSVDGAIEVFHRLGKKVFEPSLLGSTKQVIKELIESVGLKENESFLSIGGCKTFVCLNSINSIKAGQVKNVRSWDKSETFLLWQVMYATCASLTFFEPIRLGSHGETYVSGLLGSLNPSFEALKEIKGIWNVDPDEVGIFLSIGTGLASPRGIGRFGPTQLDCLVNALSQFATDSEHTAQRIQHVMSSNKRSYFRLNAVRGLDSIGATEWQNIAEIEAFTYRYMDMFEVKALARNVGEKLSNAMLEKWYLSRATSIQDAQWIRAIEAKKKRITKQIQSMHRKLSELEATQEELGKLLDQT